MHDTGLGGDVLEAYERLILDAMRGDHTLFTTAEGIERLWEVSEPLLESPPSRPPLRPRLLGTAVDPSADRAPCLAPALRTRLARPERGRRLTTLCLHDRSCGMNDLPLVLEPETPDDAEPILRLNDRVFGPGRYARTAHRIREKADSDPSLSFVARVGTLMVGAVAMTPIHVGDQSALLLGPLIVEPVFRSQGIGEALVNRCLSEAKAAGWKLVLLVGDEPYYARMGFQRVPTGQIVLPGPVDPGRLLYHELEAGALDLAKGEARAA